MLTFVKKKCNFCDNRYTRVLSDLPGGKPVAAPCPKCDRFYGCGSNDEEIEIENPKYLDINEWYVV